MIGMAYVLIIIRKIGGGIRCATTLYKRKKENVVTYVNKN